MRILLNKTTAANREYWNFIEQKSREFRTLPAWIRLEPQMKPAGRSTATRTEVTHPPHRLTNRSIHDGLVTVAIDRNGLARCVGMSGRDYRNAHHLD